MKNLTFSFLALLLALGMSGTVPAQQQGGQGAQQQQNEQSSSADFTDGQLESFAAVQTDLQQIRTEYSERLQNTEDSNAAAEIQQEANDMMVQAIEDEGLEVETYTQIAMALQQDQELRQRVQDMLSQGSGGNQQQ